MRLERLVPRRRPRREPLIRPEDILLSKRITWRIDEPFTIFECKDYLQPATVTLLAEEFPWSELRSRQVGDLVRISIDEIRDAAEFRALLETRPALRDLVASFSSVAFRRDVRKLFRNQLAGRARSGSLVSRLFYRWLPLRLMSTKTDVTLYYKGFQLTPHTDAAKKLVALLLYFEDPDCPATDAPRARASGGTGFWRPCTADAQQRWFEELSGRRNISRMTLAPMTLSLPRRYHAGRDEIEETDLFARDFERFYVTEARQNCLAGFVKSRDSWHDVDLRDYPDGVARGALLINVNLVRMSLRALLFGSPSFLRRQRF